VIQEGADETTGWLADHTDLDQTEVERGLEEGRLRRAAVVFELIDAGYTGRELVELVVSLTGLPAREARELIAAEAPDADLRESSP